MTVQSPINLLTDQQVSITANAADKETMKGAFRNLGFEVTDIRAAAVGNMVGNFVTLALSITILAIAAIATAGVLPIALAGGAAAFSLVAFVINAMIAYRAGKQATVTTKAEDMQYLEALQKISQKGQQPAVQPFQPVAQNAWNTPQATPFLNNNFGFNQPAPVAVQQQQQPGFGFNSSGSSRVF